MGHNCDNALRVSSEISIFTKLWLNWIGILPEYRTALRSHTAQDHRTFFPMNQLVIIHLPVTLIGFLTPNTALTHVILIRQINLKNCQNMPNVAFMKRGKTLLTI